MAGLYFYSPGAPFSTKHTIVHIKFMSDNVIMRRTDRGKLINLKRNRKMLTIHSRQSDS